MPAVQKRCGGAGEARGVWAGRGREKQGQGGGGSSGIVTRGKKEGPILFFPYLDTESRRLVGGDVALVYFCRLYRDAGGWGC